MTMNEQLTSDELRQVLAEWIRPMYPKQRQKIAGLFEAVIARAETAEADNRRLTARVAELEAASELAIDKWADAARSETQLRLDAAEARVAELESALGGLDALAPDYELPDGAAVAMAIGNGQILTAGRHAIHSAVMSVIDSNRDNEALRARVAELEAQLAAQGWRDFTERPPIGEQIQIATVIDAVREEPDGLYRIGNTSEWQAWRPAPQEPTQ